jgi:hypothetical protein
MITHAYRLLTIGGASGLLCLLCDRFSAHPDDIAHRYCSACHVFLADVPATYNPAAYDPRERRRRCGRTQA